MLTCRAQRENRNQTRESAFSSLHAYFRDINQTALLSPREEKELALRVQAGDSGARQHLVCANLRLVVNLARNYAGKGLTLADLIEEGNLGLLRAVEKFDPGRNTRFSTYASHWIKQSMRRALLNSVKTIRIPIYMEHLLTKWRQTAHQLQAELGYAPSCEQIARRLRLSKQKLAIIKRALPFCKASARHDSVEETSGSLDDLVSDHRTQDPDNQLSDADTRAHVLRMLNRLEPRAATVLRLRFGLEGHPPLTLKEIGDRLGLTRERVRQLEKEALAAIAESFAPD